MKKLFTGICCLAMLAVTIAPASSATQDDSGNQTSLEQPIGPRILVQELQEELRLLEEDDSTTITRKHIYHLSGLDNQFTGKAIAWEQVKDSILNELVALITEKATAGKGRSREVSTKSTDISYESLPSGKDIKTLLPGIVSIEQTGEDWGEETLILSAKTNFAPVQIASALVMISEKQPLFDEISAMRALAIETMNEIKRIQKEVPKSGKSTALNQRYLDAVHRLIATDWYEKARNSVLRGQFQQAIDAYTNAIESSPGLAIAYRNRGVLYQGYLKDKPRAIADFNMALQAYCNDALDHMKSKEYEECIEDIEAALKLNANSGHAYYQRAACCIGLDQQENARKDFIKAAQLGNKSARDILTAKGIAW